MAPNKTELTLDALDEQTALELPDRELMCGCTTSLLTLNAGAAVSVSGLNAGVAAGATVGTSGINLGAAAVITTGTSSCGCS